MSTAEQLQDSDDTDWRQRAACRGTDVDMFFPLVEKSHGGIESPEVLAAKAVCGHCAVIGACLDYALANREDDGIWGGTTYRERRRIRSARRK